MGLLGNVLEVLFGPDDRVDTVRATVRHWADPDLARKADALGRSGWGRPTADTLVERTPSKPVESTLLMWVKRPACVRIEESREFHGSIHTARTVTDGNRRWQGDYEGHVEISECDRRQALPQFVSVDIAVDRHFNPAQIRQFFEHLALESLGPVRTAGRDCVRLKATSRPGASLWPHWLPFGADEYEFHADLEHGFLLKIISRCGGELLEVHDVVDVVYNEPLEPTLFVYEPSAGEQVGPKVPVAEHLSLTAAVERMPFTVLVPTQVPDPAHSQLGVVYHPVRRNLTRAYLTLTYRGSDEYDRLWVEQSAHPDRAHNRFAWDPIEDEPSAQQNLRISDGGDAGGMRMIAFEQLGTHVTITSDLDRAQFIDFARSFVAAASKPPSH